MSFPQYTDYLKSHISWSPLIPSTWKVLPAKRGFNRRKELNTGMKCKNRLSLTLNGVLPRSLDALDGLQASEFETYQVFQKDDLVFKLIDLQNIKTSRVGLVHEEGIMSPAYIRIEPNKSWIFPRYAYWFFTDLYNREIFNNLGEGVRQTLGSEELLALPFFYPALEEQIKIVGFLDHETLKIDELINEQEKLINVLKEKRLAVIFQAVTKGLDPKVKLKESGLKWVREIPEHWGLSKGRKIFKIKKRIVGELGYEVLSITQKGIRIKDTESNEGQLSMDYSKYQLVEIGDFAMNHMDLLTGFVDLSPYVGVTSPDYRVFTISDLDNYFPEYFLYLLQNGYSNKIFYPFGQGSSQLGRWRLPTEQFKEFGYPFPPIEEQEKIASYISKETRKIDALVNESIQVIKLLQERRSALISAAVTGQIDVRNYRAKEVS